LDGATAHFEIFVSGTTSSDFLAGLSMNRYERQPSPVGEALVDFRDGDIRVMRPGAFVRCAVTGVPIPLDELKYWDVDRQEAYASPQAKLTRLGFDVKL
jgi:hypothetical protein